MSLHTLPSGADESCPEDESEPNRATINRKHEEKID